MLLRMLVLCFGVCTAAVSHAGFVVTFSEVGNDVVAVGSGSINTSSLTLLATTGNISPLVVPDPLQLSFSTLSNANAYLGVFNGPTSIGPGAGAAATSASGQVFAFVPNFLGNNGILFLDNPYVSGSSITTSMTFGGQSFASLGLAPGNYSWTFGSGVNADFLTIQVAAVPEPTTVLCLGLFLPFATRAVRRHGAFRRCSALPRT